jgi:hypothetical protein
MPESNRRLPIYHNGTINNNVRRATGALVVHLELSPSDRVWRMFGNFQQRIEARTDFLAWMKNCKAKTHDHQSAEDPPHPGD